jgi:hypothetical protein
MKIISVLSVLVFSTLCFADKKAVTENGDEVILHDNGTWEKSVKNPQAETAILINKTAFTKDEDATFQLKSTENNASIYLNPKKWIFSKGKKGEDSEYEFQMTDSDLRAMLITERIEIPLENLVDIALENAKEIAPDAYFVTREYRTVNGKKVMMAQLNGTISGIKFTYLGYYYSDAKGSTQIVTYTSQKLFPEYRNDAEKLLNGFLPR